MYSYRGYNDIYPKWNPITGKLEGMQRFIEMQKVLKEVKQVYSDREHYDVLFPKGSTEEQKKTIILGALESLESDGYEVVGAEPIEEIYSKIVGRRFFARRKEEE